MGSMDLNIIKVTIVYVDLNFLWDYGDKKPSQSLLSQFLEGKTVSCIANGINI